MDDESTTLNDDEIESAGDDPAATAADDADGDACGRGVGDEVRGERIDARDDDGAVGGRCLGRRDLRKNRGDEADQACE